jgi:cytochrome c biogenesis protein CcmG, thiol:disulfide interchange protein DsbE
VNTHDEEARARAFLDEFGITYPNGHDAGPKIAIHYGVWGLPEAYVIDADGRITYRHIGTLSPAVIAEKIDDARRGVLSTAQGRGGYRSTR